MNDQLMPFGKFKGQPISRLTVSYCQWLLDNMTLREPLKSKIEERLGIEPPLVRIKNAYEAFKQGTMNAAEFRQVLDSALYEHEPA